MNAGSPAPSSARVSGLRASGFAWRFLRSPLPISRRLHEAHGPVVEFARLLPGSRKVFVMATGPAATQAVLGTPGVWRSVRIVAAGPRNSAMRRLAHGI